MNQTRDLFNKSFISPIAQNISVRYNPSQTGLLFERQSGGAHILLMNLTGNHIQTVHYFAHEYLHILAGHWKTKTGTHTWLEEGMATTAAYFVLRRLNEQLHSNIDRALWNTNDYPSGLGKIMAKQIGPYMRQFFPVTKLSEQDFISWFRTVLPEMEYEPYGETARYAKFLIAYHLIDIFEGNPDIWPFGEPISAWNIVRYMSPYGPVSWEAEQSFKDYMRGWYLRTPARWSHYVRMIAKRFGLQAQW